MSAQGIRIGIGVGIGKRKLALAVVAGAAVGKLLGMALRAVGWA